MITMTCLIGVVVCGARLACGAVLAAAALTMAVTASTTPATVAGWVSFLTIRTPPMCWTGDAAPRTAWPAGALLHALPKRDESGNPQLRHPVKGWQPVRK